MSAFDTVRASLVERGMLCATSSRLTAAGLDYSGQIVAQLRTATASEGRAPGVRWNTRRGNRR